MVADAEIVRDRESRIRGYAPPIESSARVARIASTDVVWLFGRQD